MRRVYYNINKNMNPQKMKCLLNVLHSFTRKQNTRDTLLLFLRPLLSSATLASLFLSSTFFFFSLSKRHWWQPWPELGEMWFTFAQRWNASYWIFQVFTRRYPYYHISANLDSCPSLTSSSSWSTCPKVMEARILERISREAVYPKRGMSESVIYLLPDT